MTLRIRCRRVRPGAVLPRYAHEGDAGLDLCSAIAVELPPGSRATIPTGWALEIPEGYEGQVRPRSGRSAAAADVAFGTVDATYRGEVCVTLINNSSEALRLEGRERIAQLVVMPVPRVELEEVEALSETTRGAGGFGSTGR